MESLEVGEWGRSASAPGADTVGEAPTARRERITQVVVAAEGASPSAA